MQALEKHRWLSSLVIVLAVALALGSLAQSDFVEWDDYATIAENPALNPPTASSFFSYWSKPYMSLYFPVTQSVWHFLAIVDYSPDNVGLPSHVLHLRPGIFKLANLVAHALTGWLVMRVLIRLGLGIKPALIGALVFVLHPLQVESVAWASGLKDVLCGLFMVASVDRYLTCRSEKSFGKDWWMALLFGVLALLSKPLAMVLPGWLLVLELYFVFAREKAAAGPHPALSDSTELAEVHEYAGEGVRRLIVSRLIPFFVIAISFAIWMKLKIQTGEQVTTQVDLIYRPFIALDSISFYIQKLVWPFGLAFDYGRTPFSVLHSGAIWKTWILPTLIWIALVAFAWKRNRLWPWLAAALFIIPIIPVLGLTKFEFMDYSTVSDHYVYSSMLGVAVLFAFCVERCGRVAPPVSIVILVLLGLRSFDQTHNWKDGKSVALQTLRIDPDSWPTWGNLAGWHLDRGEFEDAERAARRSLELRPLEEKNRVSAFNLAAVMVNTNRHTEAIPLLVKVVRAEPNNVQYRLALAEAYAAVGRHADAIRQFEAARHFEPTNERALKGLAEMNRLEGDRQSTQPSTAPTTTPAQGEP